VQIAIVLASASLITGVTALVWIAGALGAVGVGFSLIAFFWPTAVHLF
jgi:membrane protein implicated in regulation of membrane protease activity